MKLEPRPLTAVEQCEEECRYVFQGVRVGWRQREVLALERPCQAKAINLPRWQQLNL